MNPLRFLITALMFNIRLYEGEPGGGGGGGGGDGGAAAAAGGATGFTQAQLDAAVEQAKTGLVTKNQELLGKMATMKIDLEKYSGIDLEAINAMQKKFKDENEKSVFEKHGFEGVVQERLRDVTTKFETEQQKLQKNFDDLTGERDGYAKRYNAGLIGDALRAAAIKAGVLVEAVDDVLLRGLQVFSVGDADVVEARDAEGNLRRTDDGKDVLTPESFIASLEKVAPHYWPGSAGVGARGTQHVSPTADIDVRMRAAADSGDMALYKKLRTERKRALSGN